MTTPKAKHTDRVTKKLKKAEERIEQLVAEGNQLSMSILNIRQMYEGCVGEKAGLSMQVTNVSHLLVGAALTGRGKSLTIKAKTLESLGDYAGVDTKALENGDLVVTALTHEEIAAMREEIEEEE